MSDPDDMDKSSPAVVKDMSPPSLLSSDLTITGDIYCEGEVQIDGKMTGNIRSDVLNIGETAKIDGEIFADSVTVYGHVNGQINARSVSLTKTAHVQGGIRHEHLFVHQGAYLDALCHRIEIDKTDGDNSISLLMKGRAKFNPLRKKTKVDKS